MKPGPVTLEDWQGYVALLPNDKLFSEALGANSLAFVTTLREEGLSPQDTVAVLLAFAAELSDRGLAVPTFSGSQFLSYPDLLKAAAGGSNSPLI